MTLFNVTYRYRLYPTRLQAEFLNHQIDEACLLYNSALEERRYAWKYAKKSVSFAEQCRQITGIRADGSSDLVNSHCAQDVLKRVDRAFQAFFRRIGVNSKKAGYPRFRSRKRYNSITSNSGYCLKKDRLYVYGLQNTVQVRLHRPIEGEIKTTTIKRSGNQWFVFFSCVCKIQPLPKSMEAVGIDVGLKIFATLSNGMAIANPRYFYSKQKRLRIAQRRVSRRKIRSNSRRKAVQLLQNIHRNIKDERSDFHHRLSRNLVNRWGLIAVEDLNVGGLARGLFAKSINDAGWGLFFNKLAYKAEWAGREFVRVNPYNTSQACSGCGTLVSKTLSIRQHQCLSCGLDIDRDLNAAVNILRLGCNRSALTWNGSSSVALEAPKGV